MKVLRFDSEEEWFANRIKIPTASNFDKIVTPAKLALSAQRFTYMDRLLGERITGTPDDAESLDYIKSVKQGIEREPDALIDYRFETGEEVDDGFIICVSDDGRTSCSPDALGERGGVEVKSPNRGTHVGYLREQKVPDKYRLQVIGSLLVTQLEWWDFVSHHPELPPLIVRTHAYEVQSEMEVLSKALNKFCSDLEAVERDYWERYGSKPLEQASAEGIFG